jgi:tight adherence protein C
MGWFTEIQVWLDRFSTDLEMLRIALVTLIGILVFTAGLASSLLVRWFFRPVKRRVETLKDAHKTNVNEPTAVKPFLSSVGDILLPKNADSAARGNIRRKLLYAGERSENAVRLFYGLRLTATVVIPCLILVGTLITGRIALRHALLFSIAGAAIGYVLPDILLARKARKRQDRIRRAMPDALDLMVVCTEAGLGLNAAIQRVADEIEIQHPDLSDELQLVILQARAGMDNRSALKDFAERTGVADVRAFVTTLLQSMRFGTSIADSLRIFAEEMRDKRLQRAQEEAAKLSVKMLGPIGLCIFPSFLLVVLGPAMLGLMRGISQMK